MNHFFISTSAQPCCDFLQFLFPPSSTSYCHIPLPLIAVHLRRGIYCTATNSSSPVFLKRNPVRFSHIPFHTTSLAKITNDYHVITSWWAILQSHLNDLSATFETVNHSLLFDTLSSLRLSSSTRSWLSYYCTGCSFSILLYCFLLFAPTSEYKSNSVPSLWYSFLFYLQLFHTGDLVQFHDIE